MNDFKMGAIRCSMAATLVLMTFAGAGAQTVAEDSWNVTPFVGVVFGGNVEDSPATGGVALGYGGRRLGVEGEIAYFEAQQGVLSQFDTAVWLYGINVLWEFASRAGVSPYALGGIAWQRTSVDLEGVPGEVAVDDGTKASFAFGGGLKARVTDRAGLRLDARFVNGQDVAPDFWRLYGGVTWKFGRR